MTAATCIAVGKLLSDNFSDPDLDCDLVHVRIVTALAHVDMVIGVHGLLGSKLAAKDLDSPIRDNLYVRSSVQSTKLVRSNRPR